MKILAAVRDVVVIITGILISAVIVLGLISGAALFSSFGNADPAPAVEWTDPGPLPEEPLPGEECIPGVDC